MTIESIQKLGAGSPTATVPEAKKTSGVAGVFRNLLQRWQSKDGQGESPKANPVNELTADGAAAKLAALSQNLDKNLSEFVTRLQEALSAAGVDLGEEFRLESDGFGGIRARNHRQVGVIEEVFRQDPELLSLFHSVGATASYLDNGDSAVKNFELTFDSGELSLRTS